MNISIEENHYIKKFLKKYSRYKSTIENNIHTLLPILIKNKPYKIKTAYGLKYKGLIVYEYKIKLDKYLDCRVAYTLENNILKVFFISDITIKKDFVGILSAMKDIS